MFWGDDVSPIHARDPDVFGRLFTASRETVRQAADYSPTDCEGQFERKIDDGGQCGSSLNAHTGGAGVIRRHWYIGGATRLLREHWRDEDGHGAHHDQAQDDGVRPEAASSFEGQIDRDVHVGCLLRAEVPISCEKMNADEL